MATKPISVNIQDIRNKPKVNNTKPIISKPLPTQTLDKKTEPSYIDSYAVESNPSIAYLISSEEQKSGKDLSHNESKPLPTHELVNKTHPIDGADNNITSKGQYAYVNVINNVKGTYYVKRNAVYDISKYQYVDVDVPDSGGAEIYDGEYVVTPKTYEQTLETEDKLMLDDVTVLSIPYYKTSNIQDGYTVYIGEH